MPFYRAGTPIIFLLAVGFFGLALYNDVKLNQISAELSESQDELRNLQALKEDKAQTILQNMSLEQKVGQLLVIGFAGLELDGQLALSLEKIQPGGVLLLSRNINSPQQLGELTNSLQKTARERNGLPLLVAVDQEGEPICRVSFADCT
ncbi:MAG: glycoside hydrolase family 3 N-terminal domain-containing protein, partial [Candidatus Paceibacteria bacterium]